MSYGQKFHEYQRGQRFPGGHSPSFAQSWELECPACGSISVDRESPEDEGRPTGLDHLAVTVHPDRDAYDSPSGTRGGYVQIDLMCVQCGERFALIIGNHKGHEVVSVRGRE